MSLFNTGAHFGFLWLLFALQGMHPLTSTVAANQVSASGCYCTDTSSGTS
jgi:putative flippase GtrA